MRRKRDEFESLNEKKKKGNTLVLAVTILAICFSGILYAWKLQMDAKYITMKVPDFHSEMAMRPAVQPAENEGRFTMKVSDYHSEMAMRPARRPAEHDEKFTMKVSDYHSEMAMRPAVQPAENEGRFTMKVPDYHSEMAMYHL